MTKRRKQLLKEIEIVKGSIGRVDNIDILLNLIIDLDRLKLAKEGLSKWSYRRDEEIKRKENYERIKS